MKKVSIVIPVYKVENYLEECLDSLVHQTYKNIEMILVDDESPDQCPTICDEYAKKDSRIRVIHKKNGGAASARNVGLNVATGEYLAFVDSDDFVSLQYIEMLVEQLESNCVDIAVCAYQDVYKDRKEIINNEKTGIYTEVEFLERFLWDWKCGLIWNKLFKMELLKEIRFEEGHVIDDEFFTYQLVMNAKKISVGNESLYYYRKRKSGVMSQGKEQKMIADRMDYMTKRFEKVTDKYPQLYIVYLENLVDNLVQFKKYMGNGMNINDKLRKIYKKYFCQIMSARINIKVKYTFLKIYMSHNKKNIENENIKFEKYFE